MKRRSLECTMLILALLLSLISVSAFAAEGRGEAALKMDNVVINEFDSTFHNDGKVVVNNFGVVYNNGGTVYNNGGTVFNNDGIVYNNGGIVFNNGAEVYNNGGTVHNNGGVVHEAGEASAESAEAVEPGPADEAELAAPAVEIPEDSTPEAKPEKAEAKPVDDEKAEDKEGEAEPAEAKPEDENEANAPAARPGEFTIEMTGDYSAFATFEGLEEAPSGSFTMDKDSAVTIRAKEGLTLTDALTTAGTCSMARDGAVTLANVDRNGRLTLKFKLDKPQFSLAPGSYDDDKHLSLTTSAEGAKVLYTTNSTSPLDKGKEFRGSLELDKSVVIRAVAVMDGAVSSDQIELIYVFPELIEPRFKDVRAGYESVTPVPAVLVNTGMDTVYVESVRLEGDDADCFVLSREKGGKVATGQREEKLWTVAPVDGLEVGEYEAEIVFTLASGDRLSDDFSFTVKK